jgi:hypothetical protein
MNLNDAKTVLGVFTLIAVTGAAQAGIASSIVLDDFDSDPNTGAGGVGDYSTIIFNNPFNQGASFSLETGLNIGSDNGAVVFNSGIGVEQSGMISYSNSGAGLNLDAIALGIQGFEIDFAMVDLDFSAEIELFTFDDMGNRIGSASQLMLISAGGDLTASWNLGDFSIADMFDAGDVDEVRLTFNIQNFPTASLDFIATEFRAIVPSPGAAALLGLGGMVMTRRKRA